MKLRQNLFFSYLLAASTWVGAESNPTLSTVEVRAKTEDLLGLANSSSEGVVSSQRLQAVPILRPGETLEMVPGMIVTQHAGDGKANQYFLRGFNLDHGTDFATYVAGVPVNMPTHAHGQGYSDLNFLIPELVEKLTYRKGPYHAEEGDFSSAGAAHIDYFRQLPANLAQMTVGAHGYQRGLLAGSPSVGDGHLLYGLEWFHNDGPWQVPEDYRKLNGILRYSEGSRNNGFSVTAMAYRGTWTSTDQVPERAINNGLIDRFGSLDPSTGGVTHRYSLSADWARQGSNSLSKANAWWLKSDLDLWSNFQYCLNDLAATGTCNSGDQFKQSERRQAAGFSASHAIQGQWAEYEVENSFGVQARIDRLSPVGLYQTQARSTLNTVRADRVQQRSLSLWGQNEIRWTPQFRSILGLRGDSYNFNVDSNIAANSGQASATLLTPKLSLVFAPVQKTELYFSYGHGFHSNDARGTTIRVDPSDGVTPVEKVSPLVRTKGYEVGVRGEWLPGWSSTLSAWHLEAASELLFVGDAGTTEPSRPSRRHGLEWTNLYVPHDWLAIDADLSWSQARYRDSDPAGNFIPGAVTATANLGLTLDNLGPWFAALRLRYFGPRPLIEDNSVHAPGSALVNARLGYKLDRRTKLMVDVYNLFDRKVNDIEYGYDSRLAGDPAALFDRHIHPTEPRTLRITVAHQF